MQLRWTAHQPLPPQRNRDKEMWRALMLSLKYLMTTGLFAVRAHRPGLLLPVMPQAQTSNIPSITGCKAQRSLPDLWGTFILWQQQDAPQQAQTWSLKMPLPLLGRRCSAPTSKLKKWQPQHSRPDTTPWEKRPDLTSDFPVQRDRDLLEKV